eukprot:1118106-Lingulodinium_polyedra.AAC.1
MSPSNPTCAWFRTSCKTSRAGRSTRNSPCRGCANAEGSRTTAVVRTPRAQERWALGRAPGAPQRAL